ncbi:MAG: WYL domain-containing protein, partial [Sphingobacteriales bacterium]
MPANKSALLRYRIIDSCLTNNRRKYPSLDYIRQKIEEQLNSSISESMLNKDIRAMRVYYDAPVSFSREHRGYYYTEPSYSIREFPLTEEEIEALDFSTALLQQVKTTPLFGSFKNAIEKVIHGYRIAKVIGKSETQLLQVEEPVLDTGYEWLNALLKGTIQHQALKLTYKGYGRESRIYNLSPYLLKEYRNRWYVAGHTQETNDIRVMALDRIQSLEPLENSYTSDPEFNPQDFFQYSFGITQIHHAEPEEVILAFTREQAPYIL